MVFASHVSESWCDLILEERPELRRHTLTPFPGAEPVTARWVAFGPSGNVGDMDQVDREALRHADAQIAA